jgi:hypothetical protein
MPVAIEPEPSEHEREAIVAAIAVGQHATPGAWEQTTLIEGVEDEPDP